MIEHFASWPALVTATGAAVAAHIMPSSFIDSVAAGHGGILHEAEPTRRYYSVKNLQVFGPTVSECGSYINSEVQRIMIIIINNNDTGAPFYPFLVDRCLKRMLCVEVSGGYPYEYGYVVVASDMYVLPQVIYANDSATWIAINLVHEVCHLMEYEEDLEYGGHKAEMQSAAWQLHSLQDIGVPRSEIEHLERPLGEPNTNWRSYRDGR